MSKNSPLILLSILLLFGLGFGIWMSQKPNEPVTPLRVVKSTEKTIQAPAEEAPKPKAAVAPMLPFGGGEAALPTGPLVPGGPGEPDDFRKQVTLLEGQIEYLQGQVRALQDENAELIQKLGSLGMKGAPKMDKPGAIGEVPDFVGMGLDMMKLRKLQALPIPTMGVSQAEVEAAILKWLQREQPGDNSQRFALALTALGWIPKPVDPLPLRAALLARQLGGWYDEASETLLTIDEDAGSLLAEAPPDKPLAIAFGQLLREFGPTLFPERKVPLSTDERMAREALIAGDAGMTRFLQSLQADPTRGLNDLPTEDPDHPMNQVPMPIFLRELSLFPFSKGFEYVQALHSAGEFPQVNAAYSRPPTTTSEVIEPERYLDNQQLAAPRVQWDKIEVGGHAPFWDDTLGKYACFIALRAHNSDEDAGMGTRGWVADRLLAYPSEDHTRDNAAWQTLWQGKEDADAFFKAMRNSLMQRYDTPQPTADKPEAFEFPAAGRFVRLLKNRDGQGVLLIDAASEAFAEALRSTLNAVSKAAP